jgi:DNA ligase (NAD+)
LSPDLPVRVGLRDLRGRRQGREAGIAQMRDSMKKLRTSLKNKIKTRESRLLTVGLSEEIGPVVAKSITTFFSSKYGKKILNRLEALNIRPVGNFGRPKALQAGGYLLLGKTFVLTGTLPTLSRDEASALIRDAGGNVTGSVSKNTDYLLTGESAGSKFDKAKELGVKIISEAEFLKLVDSSSALGKTNQKEQNELF